nr:ISAs1 family transposase [Kovacikia minuta]
MSQIIESENHYCIGLKANQLKLLKHAQSCAQTQSPLSHHHTCETSHGREVERQVRVFAAPVDLAKEWAGLAAFVAVERFGIREGKPFHRQSWFILSRVIPAAAAAEMIQAHRGTTENKLHWVKDVVQGEDTSLIQAAQPATLMAFLRSWAISLFRKAGYSSITKAMRLCKHDLPTLLSFI